MRQPLTGVQMLLYSAGSVGAGAFYAFNNFVLPPVLKSFGATDLVIGLLSSTRSIEGAVIQPTIGAASDRVWTRFGRRRPFMLVAVPLSAAFFVAAAFADSLVLLAAVIFLFSIFFNAAVDPYAALLADISPFAQRAFLSGLSTGIQLASQVAFLLLVVFASAGASGVPLWTYAAVAALLLVGFGITIVGIREHHDIKHSAERIPLRTYLNAVLRHGQAARYLGTLFVYQFGWNAVLPYLVLFIIDDIHQTEQTGFALAALALLVTALSAVAFGKLADRVGTRPVMAVGWALLAVAAVGGIVITTLPQTVAVVLLAGVGNGAATAVSWPLLTLLIPPEETGIFAGLKAASESIAIPLSVFVAAELFLPRFGYRGIFAMLAVNIVVALVLLLRFVRVPRPAQAAAH